MLDYWLDLDYRLVLDYWLVLEYRLVLDYWLEREVLLGKVHINMHSLSSTVER